jgi:hypothetical protein
LAEVYPRRIWYNAGVRPRDEHRVEDLVGYAEARELAIRAQALPTELSGHERDATAAAVGLALVARATEGGGGPETSAEERARSDAEGLIVRI